MFWWAVLCVFSMTGKECCCWMRESIGEGWVWELIIVERESFDFALLFTPYSPSIAFIQTKVSFYSVQARIRYNLLIRKKSSQDGTRTFKT